MAVKEIVVIGLGGVGGYFGFKLAQAFSEERGINITFIARSATYARIDRDGLTLLSPEHDDNKVRPDVILQNVKELAKVDLVLLCVKEYDLDDLCQQLKEKISQDTVILPLMNGVDIYDRIRGIIPRGIVLPACVYVASHIKEKGLIQHNGLPGKIIFGKDPQLPGFVPLELLELLEKAEIVHEFREDPFPEIWTKFVFIASFGLVTARYDVPMGKVIEEKHLHDQAAAIMKEIVAVAALKAVLLPENIIDISFEKANTFPYSTPTSLQLDIHSKKAHNELELFAGAILRYGKEVGVSTEATKKIFEEIKNR